MAALCSSFLSKLPYSNVSSIEKEKNPKHQSLQIKSETFLPLKQLIHYVKTIAKSQLSSSQKKKQQNQTLTNIFKSLDDYISDFLDLPLPPDLDPQHVLSGNFAPVHELPPTACEVVEGSLPRCLEGLYIRNGPNPQFIPKGPYHFADGDGMLQAIKISRGKATFCCRYVKTYKYKKEREHGFPIVPSVFSSLNGLMASWSRSCLTVARILTGHFDLVTNGFGVANTSLALIGGRLYALWEADLPYEIKLTSDGDLFTVGRSEEFRNSHIHKPFLCSLTAHPKMDPDTGEVFAFSYNPIRPFLIFFRINPNEIGIERENEVPIFSMKRASFIHDFAVTKNFAIFPDSQIVLDQMEVIRGRKPLIIDLSKVPRLGIIPRYANDESEMWWVQVPGFNTLHAANAWEEDDGNTIVIVGFNIVLDMENLSFLHFSLERITINIKSKKVERRTLSNKNLESGSINPAYAGKKNRFLYAGVIDAMRRIEGVLKVDLSLSTANCVVASRVFGPGCYGGEPVFVPKNQAEAVEEDDGYLITYVHDENSEESKFIVMNPKSPNLDIVASVKLPQRVPYGFHGTFVTEDELNKLL